TGAAPAFITVKLPSVRGLPLLSTSRRGGRVSAKGMLSRKNAWTPPCERTLTTATPLTWAAAVVPSIPRTTVRLLPLTAVQSTSSFSTSRRKSPVAEKTPGLATERAVAAPSTPAVSVVAALFISCSRLMLRPLHPTPGEFHSLAHCCPYRPRRTRYPAPVTWRRRYRSTSNSCRQRRRNRMTCHRH